ncbi:hypothetical protein BDZ91DRAFT_841573 [Kalaharituber pfeilii]|nr:hypothetical protein BDZ91DRAFT_841573 [Kalaharituber pfeilii]
MNIGSDRAGYIKALEAHIAMGYHAENAQKVLDRIKSLTEEERLPEGLPAHIGRRLNQLEEMRTSSPPLDANCLANIDAIIHAYKTGTLSVEDGKVSYWFNGKQKTGLIDPVGFNLVEHILKWRDEEGGIGRVWEESPEQYKQKASRAIFLPSDIHQHHEFWLSVRKIGGHRIDLWALDNTGSSFLELFQGDDLPSLDIDQTYNFWGPTTCLTTANGIVLRYMLLVEINLMDNQGNLMSDWKSIWATVTPGFSFGNHRCSGMYVRQTFYTGTAPDGQGILYVAVKRAGVCSHMPAL